MNYVHAAVETNTKIVIEVKFGDINNETPRAKDQSQARGYAERKETKNYMLLIYPESLSGIKYIDGEWFTDQCVNEKIQGGGRKSDEIDH